MGVSKNNGIPKSSISIGFSIINHPFWGTPIFGNTHIRYEGYLFQGIQTLSFFWNWPFPWSQGINTALAAEKMRTVLPSAALGHLLPMRRFWGFWTWQSCCVVCSAKCWLISDLAENFHSANAGCSCFCCFSWSPVSINEVCCGRVRSTGKIPRVETQRCRFTCFMLHDANRYCKTLYTVKRNCILEHC